MTVSRPSRCTRVTVQVSRLATPRVAVVAAGHDHVSGTEALPVGGDGGTVVVDRAGGDEPVADRGVERGGVLAGVDHHRGGDAAESRGGDALGERVTPLHLAGVHGDLAAGVQRVEHCGRDRRRRASPG